MRRGEFATVIGRLGETCKLLRADAPVGFAGVLRPRAQGWQESGSPLGYAPDRIFCLYAAYGADTAEIEPGDRLEINGAQYFVRRVLDRRLGAETLYRELILTSEEVAL